MRSLVLNQSVVHFCYIGFSFGKSSHTKPHYSYTNTLYIIPKMTLKKIIIIGLITIFITSCKSTIVKPQTENDESNTYKLELPERIGIVNDFENILTEFQREQITAVINYYYNSCKNDIVIITIDSIPERIRFNEYASMISKNWNVGKENGNGVSILISKSLNKVALTTTHDTELTHTSEFCEKVMNEEMIPYFEKNEYYKGILSGIKEIIKNWK